MLVRFSLSSFFTLAVLVAGNAAAHAADPEFIRGDVNSTGRVDMADAVFTMDFLFRGSVMLTCHDAADSNDDGRIDISDPVQTLNYLFLGSSPPAAPFPKCGLDPTKDGLACKVYASCAPASRCEDPAAQSITFGIVSRTSAFRGQVRITGTVRNLGGAFDSSPGQQVVQLFEEPLGGRARLVATQPFADLPAGGEVRVTFERAWDASSPAEGEFPPNYLLIIAYDPDILSDGNADNDDCQSANNSLERSSSAINEMF